LHRCGAHLPTETDLAAAAVRIEQYVNARRNDTPKIVRLRQDVA
jgi:hypothetical protein